MPTGTIEQIESVNFNRKTEREDSMSKKFSLILILGLCSYGSLGQAAHAQSIRDFDAAVADCVANEDMAHVREFMCGWGGPYGSTLYYCEKAVEEWTPRDKDKACRAKHSRH